MSAPTVAAPNREALPQREPYFLPQLPPLESWGSLWREERDSQPVDRRPVLARCGFGRERLTSRRSASRSSRNEASSVLASADGRFRSSNCRLNQSASSTSDIRN